MFKRTLQNCLLKRKHICTLKALLAEGFKGCKTLKQENTPHVTPKKGILTRAGRN
jgi:hypothetical protein